MTHEYDRGDTDEHPSRRAALLAVGRFAAAVGVGSLAGVSGSSFAQDVTFPTKPVKLIVPYPPGGVMDFLARTYAPKLSVLWKQPVVIDNKPGAGGNIAALAALSAAPDGHTILMGHTGMALNQFLMKNTPYDIVKSFAPITTISLGSAILYVNPSLPGKDLNELVSYAKSRPTELALASAGVGTIPHLTGVLLQQATGMQLTHIPYKGGAAAMSDVMGGQVHMMFDYAVPSGEFVRSGKLRALFVAGPKRVPLLPDVPTAAEAGLKGFTSTAWSALFAHASTPKAIVRKISRDMSQILATEEEQARGHQLGIDFRGSTPEMLRTMIGKDVVLWGDIIKKADIKLLE